MKAKLTFLIALAITSTLQAQKPAFNQAPRMPAAKASVAAPRSMPAYRAPAATHSSIRPAMNIPRAIAPQIIRQMTPPAPSAPRVITSRTVKPAVAPRAVLPNQKNITQKPGLTKPAAALDGKNNAAIREGAGIAEGLRSMEEIRKAFPDMLRDKYGLGEKNKGSNNGFQMPMDREGNITREFTPREVKGPRDHHTNQSGLTDIRGGYSRSRQGTMSDTGRRLSDRYSIDGVSTHTSRDGRDYSTSHSADGTRHVTVTDAHDGRITVSFEDSDPDNGHASVSTTDTYDSSGRFIGSHSVFTREDGTQQEKFVDGSTGRVAVIEYDENGATVSQPNHTNDRSPSEGASLGGPVNGSGPGVIDSAGLVPLDLLRQHANGETQSGGTNYMTSGRLNRNHTNPASIDGAGSLPSTANRNTVPVNNGNLAGPSGGGSNGGGDRPD